MGVSFHVASSDYSVGRRNILHQYPLRDEPDSQDLGLDADEFIIDGYIIANSKNDFNYFKERDALINALKQSGPGKLIHPFLGEQNVILTGKARISETFSAGGIARFSMTFSHTGEAVVPTEKVDPRGNVDDAADDLENDTIDSFYEQYTNAVQSGKKMISDFNSYVAMGKGAVNKIRNAGTAALTTVKSALDDAASLITDVVALPCQIAGLVVDVYDSMMNIANITTGGYIGDVLGQCSGVIKKSKLTSTGDQVNQELGKTMVQSMLNIAGKSSSTGFGAPPDESTASAGGQLIAITATTTASAREGANRLAFVNMVKSLSIAAAVKVAIRTDFLSFDASKEIQTDIIDSIDYLLIKLGDESASDPYKDWGIYVDNRNIYSSLENLRAAFVAGMRDLQLNLLDEIIYSAPPSGTTTLQLAYDRYSDLDRENEIFERNQPTINHPGFLNGDINILAS
jgi:prophage DNA circulation protein